MREIKFRAWDGEIMHNVSELHFCMGPKLDGNGLKFYGPGVGQGWIDGESIHLMQYTGLKDKNGKEIFEGDIIQCKHGIKGKVYWAENWAMWAVCGESLMRNADGEIIGNIYENPELVQS